MLIDKIHCTAFKDGDDRSIILNIVENMLPMDVELEKICEELRAHIEYLKRQNDSMKGEIKALTFAVRCGGISGNEVTYESD